MLMQYRTNYGLQTFHNFQQRFFIFYFCLIQSLVTLHVVLNIEYGAKLIACVLHSYVHLAEKCKWRIKTKHGRFI